MGLASYRRRDFTRHTLADPLKDQGLSSTTGSTRLYQRLFDNHGATAYAKHASTRDVHVISFDTILRNNRRPNPTFRNGDYTPFLWLGAVFFYIKGMIHV